MKTHNIQLSHSDIMQGVIEKKTYILGGLAYLKTITGKELWFDAAGHLVHKITSDYEEFRDYYEDGTLKHLLKVNQYEVFYNEKGLKTRKIKTKGIEEFWEYDNFGHLCRWYNTNCHERKYVCDNSGTVIAWYCNEALLDWYNETKRKLDDSFAGIIK